MGAGAAVEVEVEGEAAEELFDGPIAVTQGETVLIAEQMRSGKWGPVEESAVVALIDADNAELVNVLLFGLGLHIADAGLTLPAPYIQYLALPLALASNPH